MLVIEHSFVWMLELSSNEGDKGAWLKDFIPLAAAIISVLAAFVTALMAWQIARYTANQKLNEFIFQQRMRACPELYRVLSDFLKKLEFGIFPDLDQESNYQHRFVYEKSTKTPHIISVDDFISYMKEVEAWDSKEAFMLTERGSNALYRYRKWFYEKFLHKELENPNNLQKYLETRVNDELHPSSRQTERKLKDVLIDGTRDLESVIRAEVLTRDKPASYTKRQQRKRFR